MRRLLPLVCAIVLVDTMLFAALIPLLPGFAEEHALSKTGAGFLLAAYAAGVLLGSLPGGLIAARSGPRSGVLAGLVIMAVASVGFAFATDPWTLGSARLVQGFASALAWSGGLAWLVAAAPRARRGEVLGTALAAAIVGALLGPVLGGAAAAAGTRASFVAIAVLTAVLALWAVRTPGAAAEATSWHAVSRALREARFLAGIWLMSLPALLFGVLDVLVPLELGAIGWSAAAIGGVFLAAAALEAFINPFVGRISDRRGRLGTVRAALAASVAVSIAFAWAESGAAVTVLVLLASVAYGSLFAPAMALLSEGAERVGLAQAVAFGLMNAAWATGNFVGPSAAGALGEAAGDTAAYAVAAALAAATLVAVRTAQPRVGTRLARVPEQP